jgi:plastocyanin
MLVVSMGSTGSSVTAAGVVDIHVGSFYFEDSTVGDGVITARVGDQLRITFDDSGGHNAQVDALGIDTGVQGAGAVYISQVLTQPGTYELYCKPHRKRGHFTTLIVTGDSLPPTTAAPTTAAPTTAPPTTTATATTTTATTTTPPQTTAAPSTNTSLSTTATNAPSPGDATTTSSASGVTTTMQAGGATGSDASADRSASGADPSTGEFAEGSIEADNDTPEDTSLSGPGGVPENRSLDRPDSSDDLSELADAIDVKSDAQGAESSPILPTGISAPAPKTWLRSVWIGLLTAIPIAALALIAARRRPDHAK